MLPPATEILRRLDESILDQCLIFQRCSRGNRKICWVSCRRNGGGSEDQLYADLDMLRKLRPSQHKKSRKKPLAKHFQRKTKFPRMIVLFLKLLRNLRVAIAV